VLRKWLISFEISSKNNFNSVTIFHNFFDLSLTLSLTVSVFRLATHPLEKMNDTLSAGLGDDCPTGRTIRTDVARHRADCSNENPTPKATLPDAVCEPVTHPAKPICLPPRPVHTASATVSASSSRLLLWIVCGSGCDLKPTMAGHSPELTLQFALLFS
jgi:hypothetical protein